MQLRRDGPAYALEVLRGLHWFSMMLQEHLHRNLQGSAVPLHASRDQQRVELADE